MTEHRNILMVISVTLLGAGFYLSSRSPVVSAALVAAGILFFPHKKKDRYVPVIKVVLITLLAALFWYSQYYSPVPSSGITSVTFIDVGQGDSIFLELSDGKTVLIDGGLQEYGSAVDSFLKEKNVQHLDLLVASHPHADHVGGLPEVIETIRPVQIVKPAIPEELVPDTWSSRHFSDTAAKYRIPEETVQDGDILLEGDSYQLSVISPRETLKSDDLNDYSLMLRLTAGKTSFLFTADAGYTAELELLDRNLKTDVLQVGHHGSFGSTCTAFLDETNPVYAVISVGKDNDHNLPNAYVLERLTSYGARVYRTDQDGSVTFISDGKSITVSTKSASVQSE